MRALTTQASLEIARAQGYRPRHEPERRSRVRVEWVEAAVDLAVVVA